jgi:S-adenosylmethionine decarboxylase
VTFSSDPRSGSVSVTRPAFPVGHHALLDFYDVSPSLLSDAPLLASLLVSAARAAGATPLSDPVLHSFPGGGITGFLPLSESHIAVHTYPEVGYAAADIFTCGSCSPEAAVATFRTTLSPGREVVRNIARGEAVEERLR